jgi:hypothetical protein
MKLDSGDCNEVSEIAVQLGFTSDLQIVLWNPGEVKALFLDAKKDIF